MRKGRCSNDPKNCTLAGNRVELPYAGIDSVCPECNSPLAAIAVVSATEVAPQIPPSPPTYAAPAVSPPATPPPPRYQDPVIEPARDPLLQQSSTYQEADFPSQPPTNSAMRLTQLAIVGAAIALIGFFAWRMFLQPRPVSAPELSATASVTGVGSQQVTQISPAQMRRVSVAIQALGVPDSAGPVIAQLAAGSVLDVTGQINVAGVNWMRVSLPNDSSKSGFVREDQMASLGEGSLVVSPIDPLTGAPTPGTGPATGPASQAVPEIVGPIQARAPTTLYIASLQANIRQEASVSSAKVGAFEFTDAITIIGQRSVGATVWYQVQLPSGGSGWINGRLVSTSPRDIPLDRETATPTVKAAPSPAKPSFTPSQSENDPSDEDSKPSLSAMGPGTTMRVDVNVANLRKVPGATGNSIVEVLQRDTLMSVEDVQVLNGVPWYRVTSPNGAQGWVSGRTVVANR